MHKNKTDKDLTEAEEIKKRGQEYTEELYKKDLMVVWSIITVWSLTWRQTSWSMKSSEPLEALLWTKLVEMMEF